MKKPFCLALFVAAILSTSLAPSTVASPALVAGKKQEQLSSLNCQTGDASSKVAAKKNHNDKSIKITMLVNASTKSVWHAICDNRDDDPDVQYTKITKISETERLLEQKYVSIPFVGATTCVLHIAEEPGKRIDYELVRSEHLASFGGTWVLSPTEDGKSTIVEVSNHIKLKFPMPQRIVDGFAKHKLKARVEMVKQQAEATELRLVKAPNLEATQTLAQSR
jgi:hypothetical protein